MDLCSYCGGDPVNDFDPDGRFGKSGLRGAAKGIDFTWNFGISLMTPQDVTPEQAQALAQIGILHMGSPMRRLFGAYKSTPWVELLPSAVGPAVANATVAYGAGKTTATTPDFEVHPIELQWGARLSPYNSDTPFSPNFLQLGQNPFASQSDGSPIQLLSGQYAEAPGLPSLGILARCC